MKTSMEKYHNDPEYHMLVDTIEILVHRAKFTPSEIREACILACTRYEMNTLSGVKLPSKESHALDVLHQFSHSVQEPYRCTTAHWEETKRRVMAWPEPKASS